jgi:sensor c-di-GMP phosphodiesterase-like protein
LIKKYGTTVKHHKESAMFSLEEIREGFYKQEFFLEYMPTIRLADNRCVGAEALMRWRHVDRIVPPMEFFPVVEKTPYLAALTYRSVELMGRDLGAWLHEQDDIHIAINVPPEVMGRGGLRFAAGTVGIYDIPGKIMLEVSERGIPDQLSVEVMNAVRSIGVQIALDDVNTNDTNLLMLMHVHADVIKFEKSFADQMLREDWSNRKIEGIAALIRTGNFEVIVEGVTTAEQVKILKDSGVHMAQGWYFSLPLSAPDFISYYSTHQH